MTKVHDPLTADEVRDLLGPFIGDLRLGGQLGARDALLLRPSAEHYRIVDEDGDDVAFVGHPIDGRLMAAAPRLARQLLAMLDEVDR